MSALQSSYDVIVIGGGPAGSTAATLVARQGLSVLLLERERFPRFRIGESLMPATWFTLERLGALERMEASAFPRKYSVQFFAEDGRAGRPFYFRDVDPHTSSVTWQVDRASFDRLLLDGAVDAGVEVHQGVNVTDVRFDGDRAVGVAADFPDGELRTIASRVVVDASGQSSLLARRFKLRRFDSQLRHAAYFSRFAAARRDPGIDDGATLVLWTREERSWFWFIPLPGDVVSIGVVGPIDWLVGRDQGDPQRVLDAEIARCPALVERLTSARQESWVRVLRDFSYISSRIAGDGWILAGDAFGFLDPIYSTGVLFALKSGEFTADSIADAFAHGDFTAARLGQHGERHLAGMEALRKLVYAFYDPRFSFPRLLRRFPETRELITHLLMGNVYRRPVDGLWEAMETIVELPESRTLASMA